MSVSDGSREHLAACTPWHPRFINGLYRLVCPCSCHDAERRREDLIEQEMRRLRDIEARYLSHMEVHESDEAHV